MPDPTLSLQHICSVVITITETPLEVLRIGASPPLRAAHLVNEWLCLGSSLISTTVK